jgi:predicted O-methyltransferase YrrM
MENIVKKTPESSVPFQAIHQWFAKRKEARKISRWEKKGRPAPPPLVIKQRVLKDYARRYGLRIFIETGTFLGDMVGAMRHSFDRIYSIELSEKYYKEAKEKFSGIPNIELIHGDSGIEIGKLLPAIDQPALFWLDAHFSHEDTAQGDEDTPIFRELEHILNDSRYNHVIIIDDARFFGKDPAYPSIEELFDFIHKKKSDLAMTVQNDSIRLLSPR